MGNVSEDEKLHLRRKPVALVQVLKYQRYVLSTKQANGLSRLRFILLPPNTTQQSKEHSSTKHFALGLSAVFEFKFVTLAATINFKFEFG